MFITELADKFNSDVSQIVRDHERNCGKGIREQEAYWARVGEIRGLLKAQALLKDLVHGLTFEEEDEV